MTLRRTAWLAPVAAAAFALGSAAAQPTARAAARDLWTSLEVKLALLRTAGSDALDIAVETEDGLVTLRGYVASDEGKARAESIARGPGGMRDVRNVIHVVRSFAALEGARAGLH